MADYLNTQSKKISKEEKDLTNLPAAKLNPIPLQEGLGLWRGDTEKDTARCNAHPNTNEAYR